MTKLERYYKCMLDLRDMLDELQNTVDNFTVGYIDLDMVPSDRLLDYVSDNYSVTEFNDFTEEAYDYVKSNYDLDDLYDRDDIIDWIRDNYYPSDLVDVDLNWN